MCPSDASPQNLGKGMGPDQGYEDQRNISDENSLTIHNLNGYYEIIYAGANGLRMLLLMETDIYFVAKRKRKKDRCFPRVRGLPAGDDLPNL